MSPWHLEVLRRLLDILDIISTICENSWCLGEVAEDWSKANATPLVRKGKEEDPGSSGLVGLTLLPSSIVVQSSWRPFAGT